VRRDGWKEARLGDHVEIQTGFPFKSKEYTEDPAGISRRRLNRCNLCTTVEGQDSALRRFFVSKRRDAVLVPASLSGASLSHRRSRSLLIVWTAGYSTRAKFARWQHHLRGTRFSHPSRRMWSGTRRAQSKPGVDSRVLPDVRGMPEDRATITRSSLFWNGFHANVASSELENYR
jgi:hypothetical protein